MLLYQRCLRRSPEATLAGLTPWGHGGWSRQHGQAARSQPLSIGRAATSTPRLLGPGSGSAWGRLCPGGCTLWAAGSLEGGSSHVHPPQCDSPIHKTISMISAKSEISQGEITTGLSLLHNETPRCPSLSTGKVFSMHHQQCSVSVWGCSTEIPNTLLSGSCQQAELLPFNSLPPALCRKALSSIPSWLILNIQRMLGMNDLGWVLPALHLLHGMTTPKLSA